MHVYNLQAEIQDILSRVNDEGEVPTDDLLAEVDRLNERVEDRVNTLYKVIRTATACSTALRNESSFSTNKARRWETIAYHAREHVQKLMEALGVKRLETELCRPTICKGRPVVEVDEGFNLSTLEGTKYEYLLNREITLSSEKVKTAAAKGEELPEGIKIGLGKDYLRIG